jgi:hypothetical protein
VNAASPPARRGQVASNFFLVAYVAISLPVVGVGVLADMIGLRAAGLIFAAVVAALAGTALVLVTRATPRPRDRSARQSRGEGGHMGGWTPALTTDREPGATPRPVLPAPGILDAAQLRGRIKLLLGHRLPQQPAAPRSLLAAACRAASSGSVAGTESAGWLRAACWSNGPAKASRTGSSLTPRACRSRLPGGQACSPSAGRGAAPASVPTRPSSCAFRGKRATGTKLLVCLRGPGLAAREQQVRWLLATTAIRG